MHDKEINNSPEMAMAGWKTSIPRILHVMDFPKCSNADTDWYVRKQIHLWLTPKMKHFLGYVMMSALVAYDG